MFWHPLLSSSEQLFTRCRCSRQWAIIDVWKLIGSLVSVDRLVLFFSDVYHFPDLSVLKKVVLSINLHNLTSYCFSPCVYWKKKGSCSCLYICCRNECFPWN